jgi:4-amino-4-deoxy-L-arabinose transferase-like glycosyltransferase
MRKTLLVVAAFLVLWGIGLSSRSITRPDEGRYAEISREMAVSGDWVSPHLNQILYFEKPPLQYWGGALSMKALGPTPLAARLWTALLGLLGCFALWRLGNSVFGAPVGTLAALITGGSVYYTVLGHIDTLDLGVSVWMILAVLSFLRGQQPGGKRFMVLAWGLAGLGFLSKGLIALVLPGLALVIYSLLNRDYSPWHKLEWPRGLPLLLLVALPWVALVTAAHPEVLHFFFIHEHFERFTSNVHQRVEPFWYFLPILLVGTMPWVGLLPAAMSEGWKNSATGFNPHRFLLIYALVILVFFSLSGSKLAGYVLPAWPPLALLMASHLTRQPRLPKALVAGSLVWVGVLALATLLFALPEKLPTLGIHLDMDPDMVEPYRQLAPWLGVSSLILLAGVVLAHLRRKNLLEWSVLLSLCSLFSVQMALSGTQALSSFSSMDNVAQTHAREFSQASHIYSLGTYDQTLDFYIHRTVILVAFRDELDFGLQLEPQHAIATQEAFRQEWQKDLAALAVMEPRQYRQLQQTGLPMRLIHEDSRHVIVARL